MTGALAPSVVDLAAHLGAPPRDVWAILLDTERQPYWLGGFRFETSWEVGTALAIVGTLNGRPYQEAGTVVTFEPERGLSYTHWSPHWRVPDVDGNRARFRMTLEGADGGTTLALRHELPAVEAIEQHARFFWRGALHQLRLLAQG